LNLKNKKFFGTKKIIICQSRKYDSGGLI